MNKILTIALLALLTINTYGQKNLTDRAQPIVEEGRLLFRSETASWYGTDLFLEKYTDRENIGGYFSYIDNEFAKCIFFSKSDIPKVIGTITFDQTLDPQYAKIDLTERSFTNIENDLFEIRRLSMIEIQSDTLFKTYKNTNLNLIPLINGKEKKVYVLTGTTQAGVVIFGNDYLLTFDKRNKLLSKRNLHNNILPYEYGGQKDTSGEVVGGLHSHLPETGDYMTATDICTIMLYEKMAQWKSYNVVSKKYLNIWNCETDKLIVIPMETLQKISKSETERKEDKAEKEK